MTFAQFVIYACLAFAGWCIGHYVYDRWIKPLKRRTIHVADAGLASYLPSEGLRTFSDANHRRICAILDDAGFEYTVKEA